MTGFAGVIAIRAGLVVLVLEPGFLTGEPNWGMPSGRVEQGETPASAASRELAEESGCRIDASELELFSLTDVTHHGRTLSTSWNFTATTTCAWLGPADPDRLVTDARWFDRTTAAELISRGPYAPLREPVLRFLSTGESGLQWSFELLDPDAEIPEFRWGEPDQPGGR